MLTKEQSIDIATWIVHLAGGEIKIFEDLIESARRIIEVVTETSGTIPLIETLEENIELAETLLQLFHDRSEG